MMGYSTQSQGSKVWDVESSKLVVPRDVVFNESSVDSLGISIQPNEETDSNVPGPGGEIKKEVEGNIESSPEQFDDRSSGTVRKRYPVMDSEGDNDGEFKDALKFLPQLLFSRLLLKPLLLFDVLLASENHQFGMALICYRKLSSHKRYPPRSNQPHLQTKLTSGSPASIENTTTCFETRLGNWLIISRG